MRLVERDDPGFREAAVGGVFNARKPDREPAAVLRRPDRFMTEEHARRLAEIRAARDPDGVFVPSLGASRHDRGPR